MTTADHTLVYRVVGFLEYMTALRYLDPLARQAAAAELTAIDEIVREHPEFTVYTNLANRFGLPGRGTDADARQGFDWVMALARVEVAGILGTFTHLTTPFAAVGPRDEEMGAYRELLADGARMHYLSLRRDPGLRSAARSTPGRTMLMYLRRVYLAQQFLEAAAGSNLDQLTPRELADLTQSRQELLDLASMFSNSIESYLAANSGTSQSEATEIAVFARGYCPAMLAGARKEVRRGTATVIQFNSE